MRPSRIAAIVVGCLLIIPSIAMLFVGGALGLGYAFGRGDDGYFDTTLDRLETNTVAITAEDITFAAEPGSPDWVLDSLEADVRLQVTNKDNTRDVFVGIARRRDIDSYLAGVAHDEVTDVRKGIEPVYTQWNGDNTVAAPGQQDFWVASAFGPGTQEVTWEAQAGAWSVVVMNADATTELAADVNVGAKAGFVLPLALLLLGLGTVFTAAALALIVSAAHRASKETPARLPIATTTRSAAPNADHPVVLEASLDPNLSRWLWLVKWILAIPHVLVLFVLAIAFAVLTSVAALSIVFTGRYPRSLFDFNVGVLRWSWRISHYASTGGMGTDRYPPFSLHAERGDAARLDVAYPDRLSRGLVFVKWILAIPHLIIISLLAGLSIRWLAFDGDRLSFDPTGGGGFLGLFTLAAGLTLLITGRYPTALFDLIVGLNRWIYRVIAYVALMTDAYPPFRLDQGGTDRLLAPDAPVFEVDLRPRQDAAAADARTSHAATAVPDERPGRTAKGDHE